MNSIKTLLAATLLTFPLAACGDDTAAPDPTGQIEGQVVIEGVGLDGIAVALSSGVRTTTSGGGYFAFADVGRGSYTITISGYPEDAGFDATTAEATIGRDGETVTRSFAGFWIRTSSLRGTVTVNGQGTAGIPVGLSGPGRPEARTETDEDGRYAFTGLRAGVYTVEFSFETAGGTVGWSASSGPIPLRVGESRVWDLKATTAR